MNNKDIKKENQITASSKPNFWWIILFFILAISSIGTAIYIGDINNDQEFYFRVIIAISIAGIASIIPGFLDIEINWLKTTIRSGGAIGMFSLIYFFNPASINKTFKPKINLSGKWEFYLETTEGGSPIGYVEIEHKNGMNIFRINGNVDITSNKQKGIINKPIVTFESKFALITEDKIIFHYLTNFNEEGVAVADYLTNANELLFNFNDYSNMDKDGNADGILKFVKLKNNE